MADELLPGLTGKVVGETKGSDTPESPALAEGLKGKVVGTTDGEGELGVRRSYFGAFNDTLAKLPDAAIGLTMLGMEKAGIIDPPRDGTLDHRMYLKRIFNAANYEQKQRMFDFLGEWSPNIGMGKEMRPTSVSEKIAAGAGDSTAMAVPVLGAQVAGTRGATYAGEEAGRQISERVARSMDKPISEASGLTGKLAAAGERVGATGQQLIRDQVQGLAERPAGVLAGEVAAAAGSGALGTAEELATGHRTGIGDLVGGAPGPALQAGAQAGWSVLKRVSPSAMGASWLMEKAEPVTNFVVGRFKNPEGQVKGVLGEQLNIAYDLAKKNGNLQKVAEIEQAFRDAGMEPPRYTPAEMTLDPVLGVGQRRVQSMSTGDQARENLDRINTNKDRIRNFLGNGDEGAPTAIVSGLEKRRQGELEALNTEQYDIDMERMGLKSSLPQATRRNTEGATIRASLQRAKDAKSVELEAYANDLGLNNSRMTADVSDLKASLDAQFTKGDFTDKYIPKVVQDFINSTDETLGFQSYLRVRNKIGDEIGRALANNQNTEARNLVEVKKAFDDWAENGFKKYPDFAKFRQRYEEEYALPFEKGVAYEVLQKSSANPKSVRYLTSDERVAQAFTQNVESASDFMRLFQGDEAAQQSMRNVILDSAREASLGSPNGPYAGTLDPNKLGTFINKHREVLETLGLKEYLGDINGMAGAVASRQASLNNRLQSIKQDDVNKLLVKLSNGDMDPDQFIDQALKKPGQMNRIVKRIDEIGDPDLNEALKAAVVSRVLANGNIDNPTKFAETIAQNKKALTQVLGPEHFKNMEIATDAMMRAMYAEEGAAGAGLGALTSTQKFEKTTGSPVTSLSRVALAVEEGRLSWKTAAMFFGSRFLTARQKNTFDAMFQKTMTDPDFAAAMASPLDAATGKPTGPVERRIKAYLFNMGTQPDGGPYGTPEEVTIPPSGTSPTPNAPNEITIRPAKRSSLDPAPESPALSGQKSFAPPAPQAAPGPQQAGIGSLPAPQPGSPPASPRGPEYAALFPRDELGAQIAGRP